MRVAVAAIAEDTMALRRAAEVPLESFQSYPVPILYNGRVCLDFFFFPWHGTPPDPPVLFPPRSRVTVAVDRGIIVRKGPVAPADFGLDLSPDQPLGEHELDGMTVEEVLEHQAVLYGSLDVLLDIFPDLPETPGDEYVEAGGLFHQSFSRIVHKPLLAFYLADNPAFFRWVEEQAAGK